MAMPLLSPWGSMSSSAQRRRFFVPGLVMTCCAALVLLVNPGSAPARDSFAAPDAGRQRFVVDRGRAPDGGKWRLLASRFGRREICLRMNTQHFLEAGCGYGVPRRSPLIVETAEVCTQENPPAPGVGETTVWGVTSRRINRIEIALDDGRLVNVRTRRAPRGLRRRGRPNGKGPRRKPLRLRFFGIIVEGNPGVGTVTARNRRGEVVEELPPDPEPVPEEDTDCR
jgi:hypothetical protein